MAKNTTPSFVVTRRIITDNRGYDKLNKKVYPIKNELECISYSGIDITCNDLPIIKYNEVEGKLQGTCYGTLSFKDKKGVTHSEDFTKYFLLEP